MATQEAITDVSARLQLNLLLIAITISLGLFLLYSNEEDIVEDVLLTNILATDVNTITIERTNNTVSFTRQEEGWQMLSPYAYPANPARINTMMGLLNAHSYTRFPADDLDLERFLLKDPVVSIKFNNTRIDFGDSSPLGEQRYVAVDNLVHLINDSLFEQLQTPATFFLSSKLLPENKKISAIVFPDRELRWLDDGWNLTPSLEISADKIAGVVNAWQHLQALSIRQMENVDEPVDRMTIELQETDTLEFLIVNPPPQLVLAREDLGLQYHFSGYETDKLFFDTDTADTDDEPTSAD